MAHEQSTEDRLIAGLFARHGAGGKSVLTGPGDDAAVVRCPPGEELLITTDALNEGVHFPAGTSAHAIGYRALAVSLSDLAAMGARPLWAVVALSVPAAEEGWLREFADGLYALADKHGVRIIGGDFVRGPINVTVTAHGTARAEAVLRREGAQAGDGIWVSGSLGDAAAGLQLLQSEKVRLQAWKEGTRQVLIEPPEDRMPSLPAGRRSRGLQSGKETQDALVERFCYPRPRLNLGRRLASVASACMDLSDGLSQDLPRLLRSSGLAARVEVERLPLSAELVACAGRERARQLAWSGGDDYELCLAVSPENEDRLASMPAQPPVTRIGELHRGHGLEITLDGEPWQAASAGFTHF